MPPRAIAPAGSPRSIGVALAGLILLGLVWSLAFAAPPPDIDGAPHEVDDPRLSCAAVRSRIDAGRRDFFAVLAGHLEETSREGMVRLVCDDGGELVVRANTTVTGTPGLFRAHIGADAVPAMVMSCLECDAIAPRRVVPIAYRAQWAMRIVLMLAGLLGSVLFVAGWRRRPFDPVEDLTRGRAPRQAHALARPSNDRISLDGREHHARALGVSGGAIAPAAAERSAVILPGASLSYRGEGAGELAYVIGPARLATLPVRAGERAPIADGDRLELRGAPPCRVALPVPGTLARFFYGDADHARFVGRAPPARIRLHATLTWTVASAALVVALLDVPFGRALGLVLLAVAAALAIALPRQSAVRFETRLPYADLATLEITERAGWLAVSHRERPIAWLPPRTHGELAQALERELRGLVAFAASRDGREPVRSPRSE